MPPDDCPTDTEGVVNDETRRFIQQRVSRQKFDDPEIANAFIRKFSCIICGPQFGFYGGF